jgi:hypothetical protein
MSAHPEPDKVREFLDAFEEVFDRDLTAAPCDFGVPLLIVAGFLIFTLL